MTRDEWLEQALEFVGRTGSRLRIDKLVTALGVTKGSFYWHFKDRADFVSSLADYWAQHSTRIVPPALEAEGGSAEERLMRLLNMVTEQRLARYDLAMRAWAMQEPAVAEQVVRVDQFRFNYVRELFKEMGFRGTELDMRASVFVSLQTGNSATFDPEMQAALGKQLKRQHAMFVTGRVQNSDGDQD